MILSPTWGFENYTGQHLSSWSLHCQELVTNLEHEVIIKVETGKREQ